MARPIELKFKNENGFDTQKYRVEARLIVLPLPAIVTAVVNNTTLHPMGSIEDDVTKFRVVIRAIENSTSRTSSGVDVNPLILGIKVSDYLTNNTVRVTVNDVETFTDLDNITATLEGDDIIIEPRVKTIIISGLLP